MESIESRRVVQPFQFILPMIVFRFRFKVVDTTSAGRAAITGDLVNSSKWRGVIGAVLRRQVCLTDKPDCKDCDSQFQCIYARLFEYVPANIPHIYTASKNAPHPYCVSTSMSVTDDGTETVDLELTLIGERTDKAQTSVLNAVIQAGLAGIGSRRARLQLLQVHYCYPGGQWLYVPPGNTLAPPVKVRHAFRLPAKEATRLTIETLTPIRLVFRGVELSADQLDFRTLFSAVLRRISGLCAFYGQALPLDRDEFAELVESSAGFKLIHSVDLRRVTQSRYSARQKKRLPLSGVTGRMTFEGENLERFLPYLWFGQWVGAGKATTMGQGRYRINL